MHYQYQHIASFTCIHDFFGEVSYPYILFQPTATTEKKLRNHRIACRYQTGGFTLTNETNLARELLTEPLSLWFTLSITDPHWSNYTQLIRAGQDTIYYADNLQPDAVLISSGYLSGSDQVKVVQDGLELPDQGLAEVELQNTSTGETHPVRLRLIREATAWLDLKSLEEGVYVSKEFPELKFLKTDHKNSRAFAVCQVIIKPDILDSEPLKLTLRLSATDVLLRYYLPKEALKNTGDLVIVNDREEPVFGPVQEHLVANRPMLHFTSLTAYKYLHKMKESFHLKKKNGSENGITLFKNLPFPSREHSLKTDDRGQKMIELFLKL